MELESNRRTHKRFPFSSRLEVRAAWIASSARTAPAQAIDVSVGGFGFRSPLPWLVGELIAVTLPEVESTNGIDGPAQPRREHVPGAPLEIVAIVRHVHLEAGEYIIGAERHTDHY